MKSRAESLIVPILLLAAWELAAGYGVIDVETFSKPSDIALAGAHAFLGTELWKATGETLLVAAVALAWSTLAGVITGVALGTWHIAEEISRPVNEFLRAIPSIAFTPAALLIFGFGLRSEALVVAYACYWPIFLSTLIATRDIDRRRLEVASVLELTLSHRFFSIIIPSVLTKTLVGVRTAIGFALVVAVTVEIIGNPQGLGYALVVAQQTFQPALVYVLLIWLGILGFVLNVLSEWIVPASIRGDAT